MINDLWLLDDSGKGRPFIILHEEGVFSEFAAQLFKALSAETRTLLLNCRTITDENWNTLTATLISFLHEKGVRQASFVSFGAASGIVLNLSLIELKLARSLVLVDAATRSHPTWLNLITDKIENFLPLGLPLRSNSKGFDSKSFLQRVRCPVLVATTANAGPYIRSQAEVFRANLPTGWVIELGANEAVSELNRQVLEFQKVPAKCPQKNLSAA